MGGTATASRQQRGWTPVWAWFLAVIAAATLGYFFLPTGTQSIVDDVIAVAAAAAMFVGIAWHRPQPLFAWVLLAFGVLLFACGDIAYGTTQAVPSPADMLYISAYPLLALGLAALARSKLPGRNDSVAIDAIVVAGGVGVVALVALAVPGAHPGEAGSAARAVASGYPVADLALLAVMFRPMRSVTARGLPCVLMGTALFLRLIADAGYALMNFGTAYTVGNAADAAWLLSFACFGAAVLHPMVAQEGALMPVARTEWSLAPAATRPVHTRPVPITRTQAIRFRVVMAWAGGILLALGGSALLLGGTYRASDVLMLGGAYGTTGSFTLIASAIRS